jgi:hypothetical protein
MPASGGATVPSPGTNLAKTKDRAPCFANNPSVRRTQESGSSEILQRSWRILIPRTRPIPYHTESAVSEANTLRKIDPPKLNRPVPASAPAAKRIGKEGTGRPICSANTHASKTTYPWCRRNSSALCMIEPGPGSPLLRCEGSSMPPTASHNKLAQRLPRARR